MLNEALDAGKQLRFVEAESIHDDMWIVCPYLMGTSGPETEEQRKNKQIYGLSQTTVTNMPLAATKLLIEQHIPSVTLSGAIPYEIGGAATASAVATAAWLDVSTIDADFVGRSVPEVIQMMPAVYGMNLCPTASSDPYGNETIIKKTCNQHMTEHIGKALASASCGLIGQATLLRQAKEVRPFMLTKTLSMALEVGRTIRQVQGHASELSIKLNDITNSQVLFEGIISKFDDSDQGGYYVGDIIIDGVEKFSNHQLKIWFKNENIAAWLDDEVLITAPDLISIVDKSTCLPLVNNQLKVGLKVLVFGTPCHQAWRNKEALGSLSPRYFGLELDPKFLS